MEKKFDKFSMTRRDFGKLAGAAAAGALAVINEFAAFVTTRQFTFFFYHSIRLCTFYL